MWTMRIPLEIAGGNGVHAVGAGGTPYMISPSMTVVHCLRADRSRAMWEGAIEGALLCPARCSPCLNARAIRDGLGRGPPRERGEASGVARGEIASSAARLALPRRRAVARVNIFRAFARGCCPGTQNGERASPQVSASLPASRSSGQSSRETLLLTSRRSPALGRGSLFR
jgi:hypothetical protein